MENMNRTLSLLILLLIPMIGHTDNSNQDIPVSLVYNPVITITPDQHNETYPEKLPVKLIINEIGRVERVIFYENTPERFKDIVNSNMKIAKFTPYIKKGIAVKSIVPFTVSFFIQSEYDYNGELGD